MLTRNLHLYIQTAWQIKTKWSFQHSWHEAAHKKKKKKKRVLSQKRVLVHNKGTELIIETLSGLGPEKNETLFYGRADLPSRVGWSGRFFLNIFFHSGGKNYPKNKKISPKFWENILNYFQIFSAKFVIF